MKTKVEDGEVGLLMSGWGNWVRVESVVVVHPINGRTKHWNISDPDSPETGKRKVSKFGSGYDGRLGCG